MRADVKPGNGTSRRFIAVSWQDCAWQPRIEVRRPPQPPDFYFPRRDFPFYKTMKTTLPHSRRHRAGFTLVELLTVITIIGILAALLLPVLAAAKRAALKTKAQTEIQGLATAIQGYDSLYGRFPVSAAAQTAANPDFTYGGILQSTSGLWPSPLPSNYCPSNSDVIAILMDMTAYPSGAPTCNTNHVKNPQQTKFLNAKLSGYDPATGGSPDPGVDITGVYRDPWGNPYVITMDLNYDDMCEDAFYGLPAVSNNNLSSLIKAPDGNYAYRGKVMVWSAGPDGQIDKNSGTAAANKDNVLSWQ